MAIYLNKDSIILPTTEEHRLAIIGRVRASDRSEAYAMGFVDIDQATKMTLQSAKHAWTWMISGKVGCIFGISTPNFLSGGDAPWFISTDEVEKHRFHFLRHCRIFMKELHAHHPVLENVVDARYVSCVSWLKWLGFTVHPAEPMGAQGILFHKFEMRNT